MKSFFPKKDVFYISCIVEMSFFITAEIKTRNMIFTFFSLCHNVLKFQTNTAALEEVQASLLLNWFKLDRFCEVDDNDFRAVMKKI